MLLAVEWNGVDELTLAISGCAQRQQYNEGHWMRKRHRRRSSQNSEQ